MKVHELTQFPQIMDQLGNHCGRWILVLKNMV